MLLTTHEEVPEELVYQMTKTLATHPQEVREAHSIMKDWEPEDATLNPPIPYHPGALRYWEEAGIR
jgi:TRAP-type uncharacterized transport system substrate-binding protein